MADLSLVPPIVADAYRNGGQFFLTRVSGEFFLTSQSAMPDDLLLIIEQHKQAVYVAIGGDGSSDSGGGDDGTTPTDMGRLTVVLKGLAEILAQRGLEVLPSDEITQESLNRHYYHFSTKFDAIAAAFGGLV